MVAIVGGGGSVSDGTVCSTVYLTSREKYRVEYDLLQILTAASSVVFHLAKQCVAHGDRAGLQFSNVGVDIQEYRSRVFAVSALVRVVVLVILVFVLVFTLGDWSRSCWIELAPARGTGDEISVNCAAVRPLIEAPPVKGVQTHLVRDRDIRRELLFQAHPAIVVPRARPVDHCTSTVGFVLVCVHITGNLHTVALLRLTWVVSV